MLKINLLPESARKAALSPIEHFHRTPLMKLIAVILVLIPLLLAVPLYFRHQQLLQLNRKIESLQPAKAEVERLQLLMKDLHTQESAYKTLGIGQGLWAKGLNVLSDSLPEGVWFTDLSIDEEKELVIQGSAVGADDQSHVGNFVETLKADPNFSSAVKEIKIDSMKRIQQDNIEILEFTVICALKKDH